MFQMLARVALEGDLKLQCYIAVSLRHVVRTQREWLRKTSRTDVEKVGSAIHRNIIAMDSLGKLSSETPCSAS